MTPQEKREAYHEAKVMSAFDHPNIIKFKEVYTTTNGKLNIVMNYADGGDLSSKLKSQRGRLFSENEILDIFVQICLAIKHVHDRKVLHRDIKGQNIFLMKNGMIKLGDFGISKVLTSTIDKARTMVGTPYYLSPEIVEGKPYNFKSDVWSLGVLLYELCTLKPPFDGSSIRQLGMNIVRGTYPPLPAHFTKELKGLVAGQLTVDPNKRPTVGQMLKMPFIMSRIRNVLSESVRFQEFSHTIFHNQDLYAVQKKQEMRNKDEEMKKKMNEDDERKKNEKRLKDEEENRKVREIEQKRLKDEEENRKVKEIEQKKLYREAENRMKDEEIRKKELEFKKKEANKANLPVREPLRREFSKEKQIEVPKPKFNEIPPFKPLEERQPEAFKPKYNEIPPFRPIEEKKNNEIRQIEVKVNKNIEPRGQILYKPPSPAMKYNPYINQKIEEAIPDIKPVQKELLHKPEKEAKVKYEDLIRQREKDDLEEKRKQEENEKNREIAAKKREEERKKMLKDIKKKKKNKISKKNNAEGLIHWVGDIKCMIKTEDSEQERLLKVLQEAAANSSEEDNTIIELPTEENEEIIEIEDKIGVEEELILEKENLVLEDMRFFIEDHIGKDSALKAYKIAKEIQDKTIDEAIIEDAFASMGNCITKSQVSEFLPLLQTLIFLEGFV